MEHYEEFGGQVLEDGSLYFPTNESFANYLASYPLDLKDMAIETGQQVLIRIDDGLKVKFSFDSETGAAEVQMSNPPIFMEYFLDSLDSDSAISQVALLNAREEKLNFIKVGGELTLDENATDNAFYPLFVQVGTASEIGAINSSESYTVFDGIEPILPEPDGGLPPELSTQTMLPTQVAPPIAATEESALVAPTEVVQPITTESAPVTTMSQLVDKYSDQVPAERKSQLEMPEYNAVFYTASYYARPDIYDYIEYKAPTIEFASQDDLIKFLNEVEPGELFGLALADAVKMRVGLPLYLEFRVKGVQDPVLEYSIDQDYNSKEFSATLDMTITNSTFLNQAAVNYAENDPFLTSVSINRGRNQYDLERGENGGFNIYNNQTGDAANLSIKTDLNIIDAPGNAALIDDLFDPSEVTVPLAGQLGAGRGSGGRGGGV